MKKLSKLLVLALMFGLLTGCKMREEIGFKIDENQKLSFRFVYAMDDEMIDAMINSNSNEETSTEESEGNTDESNESTEETTENVEETTDGSNESTEETITDEKRWEFLKKSVEEDYGEEAKYEKYEADGFKGYVVTKELGNLEDFVTTEETERVSITGDDLDSKKLFAKTENGYKSIMKLDKSSDNMSGISQYQQMGALFDIKFVVTLPNKAISNNATNVSDDGLTLTWNLLTLTDENIDFEFKVDGNANNPIKENNATSSNLMMYLGIGGLILLIAMVLLIIISKKKENHEESSYNNSSDNEFINAVQYNNEPELNETSEIKESYVENEIGSNETNEITENYEEDEVNEIPVEPTEANEYPVENNEIEQTEINNLEETSNSTPDEEDVVKVEPFDEN